MACLTLDDLNRLHGFELSDEDSRAFKAHLSTCTDCAAMNAQLLGEHEQVVHLLQACSGLLQDSPRANGKRNPFAGEPILIGYKIVREIHRGGQGIVFEAIQESTQRRVAIKMMRDGPFASPRDQARFQREVQILARLKRPNIVTIYDSGVKDGWFYSVMDYVPGLRLDEHFEREPIGRPEALRLFQKICEAVGGAHGVGIIHRDLKPGNILVNPQGEPFVLDFGLAKSCEAAADQVSMTQTGHFMGSLPWASPQQVQGEPLDARTDVYSLGVAFYQCLTRRFPYSVEGPISKVVHCICHDEPCAPSRIDPGLDEEIDAILLKCLSKEPERRYADAGQLARDLGRCLRNEPIEAKRDSGLYVLRKRLRRHRLVVSMLSLVILCLTALVVTMSIQSKRVAQSRDEAVLAKTIAQEKGELAIKERRRAEKQAEQNGRLAYKSQISAAQSYFDNSAIVEMKRVLAETDPARRGWEWQRLSWLTDRSVMRIPAPHLNTKVLTTCEGKLLWGTSRGRICCYDPAVRHMVYSTVIDASPVLTLALAPDALTLHVGTEHARFVMNSNMGGLISRHGEHGVRTLCPCPNIPGLLEVSAWPDVDFSLIDLESDLVKFKKPWGYHWGNLHSSFDSQLMAISPGGGVFAIASGASASLFTIKGAYARSYSDPRQLVSALTFSPDGASLAMNSSDGLIRIWDCKLHQVVSTLNGHARQVSALQYSHDGKHLVSGSIDGSIRVWNVRSTQCLRTFYGHSKSIISVAFFDDDQVIASASQDQTIRLWDTREPDVSETVVNAGAGFAMLSPDGQQIAVRDGAGLTIAKRDGNRAPRIRTEGKDTIISGFFSDGTRAYVGDEGGIVTIWDVASRKMIKTLYHLGDVSCAASSPDGKFFVTGSGDHTCRIWNEPDLSPRHCLLQPDSVWDLAISHDSRWVVCGGKDGVTRLWDPNSGKLVREWSGLGAPIDAFAFTRDDRSLAVGCKSGLVRIYNVNSGQMLCSFNSQNDGIYSAAFTPDGRRLVLGTRGIIEVRDPHSGELVFSFRAHNGPIFALQFFPEGATLLTSSHDASFKIWPAHVSQSTQPGR